VEEDIELEELRRKKLEEYKRAVEEAYRRERERREFEAKKEAILRKILTPEARSRLENIKLVKPEFASQVEIQLIQLALSGKINRALTDEEFKSLLKSLYSPTDFKIKIKKKEFE